MRFYLPYDRELEDPAALVEWIKEEGVRLDIREMPGYPTVPLHFSEYHDEPPTIVVFRYSLMDDWLNMVCQTRVGYYGPWYFLHVAYYFYFYLELNGRYEIERKWYHQIFGALSTIEDRAYHFARIILGTLHHPRKFDEMVITSFRPGPM